MHARWPEDFRLRTWGRTTNRMNLAGQRRSCLEACVSGEPQFAGARPLPPEPHWNSTLAFPSPSADRLSQALSVMSVIADQEAVSRTLGKSELPCHQLSKVRPSASVPPQPTSPIKRHGQPEASGWRNRRKWQTPLLLCSNSTFRTSHSAAYRPDSCDLLSFPKFSV